MDDTGVAGWVADELAGDEEARPIEEFLPAYRDAVATDLEVLRRIRDRLSGLDAGSDPKLAELRTLLEASTDQKIAVFATFGDTIRYLEENLPASLAGRERVVVIGSETDPDSRTASLARFCPQTVVRPGYEPPDGEVDLLLSTDVLSEGQNLQQASAVISYDMPWNPQRVVQRNGRVIRLKSPHDEVHLCTMLPEPGELERLLQLEATIRRKILAASVYGMESEVIEGIAIELRNYATRLEHGDESLLDDSEEEAAVGFAGEELRRHLQRAIEEGELGRLRSLPWGIGAAFRQYAQIVPTEATGIFFACRTGYGDRYWRYVERGGAVIDSDAEMLRRIYPGREPAADLSESPIELETAWRSAILSIVEEHNRRADPHTDEQRLGPVQRFALEVLRDPAVALPQGATEAELSLSVERSTTVRHALGEIRNAVSEGSISRDQAAERVVGVVRSFGLQPIDPPEPVPVITEDDVGVVCWMAVLPEASTT
jgi:hypothetical protein